MTLRRFLLASGGLLLGVLVFMILSVLKPSQPLTSPVSDRPILWEADLQAGLYQARAGERPVLLYFTGDG